MPRFTFARLDASDSIDVNAEITKLNRDFERRYSDCTVQIVESGDYGTASQWVTVDVESLDPQWTACIEWYTTELANKHIALRRDVEASDFNLLISQTTFNRHVV